MQMRISAAGIDKPDAKYRSIAYIVAKVDLSAVISL
jgi:hypothetical protein